MSTWDVFRLVLLAWGTVAAYYVLCGLAQYARTTRAQRRNAVAASWDRHVTTAGVTPIRYTPDAPRLRAVK